MILRIPTAHVHNNTKALGGAHPAARPPQRPRPYGTAHRDGDSCNKVPLSPGHGRKIDSRVARFFSGDRARAD